jgi:hypothetical protein
LSLLPDQAKPDYLAIHVYTTTFESFRDMVEKYHRTFGLPIMLTEFAMQVGYTPRASQLLFPREST